MLFATASLRIDDELRRLIDRFWGEEEVMVVWETMDMQAVALDLQHENRFYTCINR